ncbi:MAG: hypothetical protein J5993_03340 [Clostridia bacterium]|nr:hypothetical protein [Clostridia bacterium]
MDKFRDFLKTSKGRTCFVACLLALFMIVGSICIAFKNVVKLSFKVGIYDYNEKGKVQTYLTDSPLPGQIEGAHNGFIDPIDSTDVYCAYANPNDFFAFVFWQGKNQNWKQTMLYSMTYGQSFVAYFMPDYDSDLFELKVCHGEKTSLLGIRRVEKSLTDTVCVNYPYGNCNLKETAFGYRISLAEENEVSTLGKVTGLSLVAVHSQDEAMRLLFACAMLGERAELVELFDGIEYRGAYVAVPTAANAEYREIAGTNEMQAISSVLQIAFYEADGTVFPYFGTPSAMPEQYDALSLSQRIQSCEIEIGVEGMRRNVCYQTGTPVPVYRYRNGGENWRVILNDQILYREYTEEVERLRTESETEILSMRERLIQSFQR